MQAILAVTVPFFALVLCGYLAARQRVLPEAAIPGLNAFVLFFALPCMLFRFGASQPFAQLINPSLIAIYALAALVIVFFTVAVTLRRVDGKGVDTKNAAFGALVAAFPNTGFMGVPLLVALLGDRAAGPVIGTILTDLFLTSSLCIALAQAGPADDGQPHDSVWATVLRSLRGALSNPLPWSIGLGAALAASGLALPEPVSQVIKMLADAASPVALFTIGAVLWRAGQHAHTRTPLGQYLPVALIKLFVHPLLVLGIGLLLRAGGLPVPEFGLMVLMLAAALPSASNVSLLAERYGADNGRVARIIMASTVLAFLTFSLLAWGVGVGRG
ncbi:AEC family transporter [Piscinibacter sp. HJYY11]|uniref:AEC family transporter n=1 Tax=Piscinibacter sp. HJYY11 TaxID=2801333 RepID=UPI00191FFE3E|nr:AEC family transporter [Piscinibacter sp. HJYY11]MBL0729353.1 AEC family transporter [Piscinibacter sp. HJYY11]